MHIFAIGYIQITYAYLRINNLSYAYNIINIMRILA